jgi:hypothetical protein
MYNRRILIEHFGGRRRLDDPEVLRQFELLREQAISDWKQKYAGKDDMITVDDVEEDYLNELRLATDTQHKLRLAALIVIGTIIALTAAVVIIRNGFERPTSRAPGFAAILAVIR